MLDVLSENDMFVEDSIDIKFHLEALEKASDHLVKNFGKLDIELGDIQRHIRGDISLPVSGMIDMIAPTHIVGMKDGKIRAVSGESYIMLIKYSDCGPEIETVIPYGSSSNPNSPHYTDQMQMYTEKKLKKMSLDKDEILSRAVRIYSPN